VSVKRQEVCVDVPCSLLGRVDVPWLVSLIDVGVRAAEDAVARKGVVGGMTQVRAVMDLLLARYGAVAVSAGVSAASPDVIDIDDDDVVRGIGEVMVADGVPELVEGLGIGDWFWDQGDELAPFGSDEGDEAFREFQRWRSANPGSPVMECIRWVVETVGEVPIDRYDDSIVNAETAARRVAAPEFDDQQFIFTVDVSVVATVLGQLVLEARVDADAKAYADRALRRLVLWARASGDDHRAQHYVGGRLEQLRALLTMV
jgi:uncharacterized protein YfeS